MPGNSTPIRPPRCRPLGRRQFTCKESRRQTAARFCCIAIRRAEGASSQLKRGDAEASPARAEKDKAIDTKKAERFEAELQKIAAGDASASPVLSEKEAPSGAGLAKQRGTKDAGKIRERIGRLKERYARAAQHYAIEFALDKAGKKVTAITWSKNPKPGSAATHPGVYCLRTTLECVRKSAKRFSDKDAR